MCSACLRGSRDRWVEEFLLRALAGGDMLTAELEAKARAASLLGEYTHIPQTRCFPARSRASIWSAPSRPRATRSAAIPPGAVR